MNWFIYLFRVPFCSFYGPGNNGIRLRLWTHEWQNFASSLSNTLVFCLQLFFRLFKYKITIEPVRFASLIRFLAITTFVSLRYIHSLISTTFASLRFLSSILKTCLLCFANLIFGNNYVRFASLCFASLDSQFYINLLRFASISKFFHINMFALLRNKFSNY